MKKLLILIIGSLIILVLTTKVQAQILAKLMDCNSILIEYSGMSKKIQSTDFAYILEKSIAPDIWMSQSKVSNEKSRANFLNLKPGIYRVKLSYNAIDDKNVYTSNSLEVKFCKDNEKFNKVKIILSPNPSSDLVKIYIEGGGNKETKEIQLYNTVGILLKSLSLLDNSIDLNISDLAKGIYILFLKQGGKISARERLVIY